ncbi:MAG TPA: Trm112 family protein [Verrucomicrobiae bacterium]|jgi:uncharacterized protein YbaR (Trm112 family)|nr:Trm112 family protein [Verrucomicrobiae bacterium]
MKAELLEFLCCPETHQKLRFAENSVIEALNRRIARGELKARGGKPVSVPIEGGLIREDAKYLYPVRGNIPVLIIEEAIPL